MQNNLDCQTDYICIYLRTKEELFDSIVAMLTNYPILGIEERNDDLIVSFRSSDWKNIDTNELLRFLRIIDNDIFILKIETIQERNWNEEWENAITPVVLSPNIAIVPSWKVGFTNAKLELIIDPKMSFGTGHHSTTRLMCYFAVKLVQKDSFWIDIGTGTGILAILARKLGAKEVLALDNNFWSIQNALENFRKNGFTEGIDLYEMDIDSMDSLPEADGIFANLSFELIIRNLKKFFGSLVNRKGNLIISGILAYDLNDLTEELKRNCFEIIEIRQDEEWIGAQLKPRKLE